VAARSPLPSTKPTISANTHTGTRKYQRADSASLSHRSGVFIGSHAASTSSITSAMSGEGACATEMYTAGRCWSVMMVIDA